MKKIIAAVAIAMMSSSLFADTFVNGYYKQNGTYVQPYVRSNPDNQKWNNYSTEGNYNPYSGKQGYVKESDYYNIGDKKFKSKYNW